MDPGVRTTPSSSPFSISIEEKWKGGAIAGLVIGIILVIAIGIALFLVHRNIQAKKAARYHLQKGFCKDRAPTFIQDRWGILILVFFPVFVIYSSVCLFVFLMLTLLCPNSLVHIFFLLLLLSFYYSLPYISQTR
jgi:hypothetical protein